MFILKEIKLDIQTDWVTVITCKDENISLLDGVINKGKFINTKKQKNQRKFNELSLGQWAYTKQVVG